MRCEEEAAHELHEIAPLPSRETTRTSLIVRGLDILAELLGVPLQSSGISKARQRVIDHQASRKQQDEDDEALHPAGRKISNQVLGPSCPVDS